jgi:uncharacterized protein (TIGR02996 family)
MTLSRVEEDLLRDPDNVETYLVYADLLQSRGDPRGELIAMDHRLLTHGPSPELQRARDALFARHREAWLGDLSEHGPCVELSWRLGFIKSARIALDWDHYDAGVEPDQLLARLLAHPSARFLQELRLGMVNFEGENFYDGMIDVLVGAGPHPTLRRLHIGDYDFPDETEISWTEVGDAGSLWPHCEGLREVILQGGGISLGEIDLPELRSFEVRTGGLDRAAIRSICSARWPELRRLVLWFGDESYGAEGTTDDIRPVLDGTGLPSLRHLGLMNADFTDAICAALPAARILPRLLTLDLSMGVMTDEGARRLSEHREAFLHLQRLDLSDNYLEHAGVQLVQGLCGRVETGRQKTPYVSADGKVQRYPSVGE